MKTLPYFFLSVITWLITYSVVGQSAYKPNLTLRNEIRKDVWQKLKPLTPKNQRLFMGLVFGSNGVFSDYEKLARQNGFQPYELATVVSFFRIIGEEVVSGKEYSKTQISSVHERVSLKYSNERIDESMDARSRQQKYDVLILKSYWLASIFKLAKKNSPQIQQMAKRFLEDNPIGSGKTELASRNETDKTPDSSKGNSSKNSTQETNNTNSQNGSLEAVEDIILRTVTSYGLNGVYVDNEVSVLFKNGDLFTNPSDPIGQLDVEKSKKANPNKWDKWQKRGNVIFVTKSRNGKTYDWKKWFKVRSGKKGYRISGKFYTADPFGGAKVINASTVSFLPDGKFAWKTVKGGNTVWKPIYSKTASSGTYSINQHTITLRYNDGKSESFFFGLYPKDDEHFIIGVNHFVPAKD